MLEFDWDENKNKSNRRKHGIWFEEVQSAFDDPNGRLFLDEDHFEVEDRYILIAYNSLERLLVIVHCQRDGGEVIRIISARKATNRERKFYEEGI